MLDFILLARVRLDTLFESDFFVDPFKDAVNVETDVLAKLSVLVDMLVNELEDESIKVLAYLSADVLTVALVGVLVSVLADVLAESVLTGI